MSDSKIKQLVADGYVNLNQMANAAGKRIDNWLRIHSTEQLLNEFKSDRGIQPLETLEGRSGGTWAHPDIAVYFGQWCKRPSRKKNGKIVYLIQAGKYAKIGKTTLGALGKRLSALQVGNPEELKVLAVIDGYSELEEALHAKYNKFKVRGEWFLFNRSMLSDFGIDEAPH